MSRLVITVITNKCRGQQQSPCEWQRSLVCPATLAGSYLPPELPLIGNFGASGASAWIWMWTCVKRQASIAALCKKVKRCEQVLVDWFNWELSLSSFAVLMRGSAKCCKTFYWSPPNSILAGTPTQTPLGSLQRSPGPIAVRRRGEGATRLAPLF